MVDPSMVRVMGKSAFHDTTLTSSGDLSYLGGEVGKPPSCKLKKKTFTPQVSHCAFVKKLLMGFAVEERCSFRRFSGLHTD